ncbi:MAG: glycosyltransferase family 2 protein [Candidatus Microgenomates bacterium]
MKIKLSLLTATKNNQDTIEKTLKSAKGLVDEIVIIDNGSKDNTLKIAEKYQAKIFYYKGKNLGRQYKKGLMYVKNDWVMILDSDECLTHSLKIEIKKLIKSKKINNFDGYIIPFQNHFLGKKIRYGGEDYKMLRLFKKNLIMITPEATHQKYILKSKKIGYLKNKINHYSYRSIFNLLKKFTYYAVEEAKKKYQKNEKSSIKKLFLYPIHMFYARFIKDKGYQDGLFRIPLDLAFAYMEFLTYLILFILTIKKKIYE